MIPCMGERAPPAGSGAPHALHRNWSITHAALASTRPHGLGDTLDAVLSMCWAEHGCNTLAEHGCPGEGRCRWCVVLAKHLFTEAVVGRSSTLAPTPKQPHQLR